MAEKRAISPLSMLSFGFMIAVWTRLFLMVVDRPVNGSGGHRTPVAREIADGGKGIKDKAVERFHKQRISAFRLKETGHCGG
jgi:hypothetical protein